ncbi:MarR family winged helix-turn-helix transcriptional regulator [Nocardioides nitrophenolicus]|uniref:MarR family winged helix-turn-helix transcriptional regulator n=1 Tax=Nocardioides nitrophenolicus TaxID=60489 RepID=UPI0019574DAD|nr:MarR family transcriptional regulator [Nocardioides nitrophenolicus]MBM7518445.1 DNA-binding MarR family transcriptional regulator [Nocardioides nitrophenolicus]
MTATLTRGDALKDLEAEVGVLIRRVRRVIGERARAVHPDLLPASYLMLSYVLENGPLRASAMCAVFDIDKGAISRQVQHLIDLGLVDRAPDPEDGRATLLSVSEEGARRMEAVAAERREQLAERLGDWNVAELQEFAVSLRRYNDALGIPSDR